MSLQDYRGSILMAGCGGLAEYHVSDFIGMRIDTVLFGKVKYILAYLLLFLGGAGDFCDLVKIPNTAFGCRSFTSIFSLMVLCCLISFSE